VLIADDHTLVAEACSKLLQPEFDVVGVVADGRALLRAVPQLQPDVVVLDIGMPLLNGLDAGEQVKQISGRIKLVYLTMNQDAELATEAFRRGASGYLLKTGAASELAVALRSVLKGKSYVSPRIAREMKPALSRTGKPQARPHITPRQKEVLQLLAEGRSMKEVANVLELKPRTVAYHKYRIMEVLRIKSNAELVQYAIRNRMIES
jgi:DNA-binding NarL/FixJ family response regulator